MLSFEARMEKSEIKSHNKDVEFKYNRDRFELNQQKGINEKNAKEKAKEKVFNDFCKWINESSNVDFIVSSDSDLNAEISGLHDKRITIVYRYGLFGNSKTKKFEREEIYEYREVEKVGTSVSVGGESYGLRISADSSGGYSVSSNTRDSASLIKYNLKYENKTARAGARIDVLRVQKGKAQEVLDSFKLLEENRRDYNWAKGNKDGIISNISKPLINAYNWVYFLAVISLLGVIASTLFSFGQFKERWCEFFNFDLNIPILTSYAILILSSAIFLILFAAFIIVRCITLARKKKLYWNDSGRFLFLTIAFLFTAVSIGFSYWYKSEESSTINFILIIASVALLLSALISIIYFFKGLAHIISNPNYKTIKNQTKKLDDFLASDTYKNCCEAEENLKNYILY